LEAEIDSAVEVQDRAIQIKIIFHQENSLLIMDRPVIKGAYQDELMPLWYKLNRVARTSPSRADTASL